MSAPLPLDRTDLNTMLRLSGPRLGCGRSFAFYSRGRHRDGWRQTKSESLSVCSNVVKLSRCKGARDNALYNDEGCDRITLEHA